MNKVWKFLLTSLSLILLNPNATLGFLDDAWSFDLYKTIDKWNYELTQQIITQEAKWNSSNPDYLKKLNQEAALLWLKECFKNNLNIDDLNNLYLWDSSNFNKKIIDSCWNWDENSKKNIETNYLEKYQKIWKLVYSKIKNTSENKVDNIYKLSKIWMYSDWNTKNSPFDIIDDLKAIDDIVFEKEFKYNWENTTDLTTKLLNVEESEVSAANMAPFVPWEIHNITQDGNFNSYDLKWLDNNNFVCDINDPLWNQIKDIINDKNADLENLLVNNNTSSWSYTLEDTWYEVKWDNWVWPCYNFFCIQIDFVMNSYDLLIWWKNNSIEWLIKRSNQHLKKIASTSLVQSKMTTNNFELWLKDLDLSEIFHVWIHVSTKPAPILNLDKNWDDPNKSDLSSNSLLERYYWNLWLDYKRANDLNNYRLNSEKLKNIQMLNWLNSNYLNFKNEEYDEYKSKQEKRAEFVQNNYIDQKLNYNELDSFYNDFIEVENFTYSMLDYAKNLNSIIKWMNKIPKSSK